MSEIVSVSNILNRKLVIPNYQRPYKWQNRNVIELLDDINCSINDARKYEDFKYRIGTIILYKDDEEEYEIVDGQQRLLSLALIMYYLKNDFTCSLLETSYNNKIAQDNICKNYESIKNWFSLKNEEIKTSFIGSFDNILEVVVIEVDKLSSAFQLFDSQNTRGKALDPHDLLKAYHLREMRNDPYEMYHAVSKWESFEPSAISNLFDVYLFPILNWSRKDKTPKFSVKYIDYYKGISEDSVYSYARRARKANPYFQITEPFTSGNDFFEMVTHYLILLEDIERELENNQAFKDISDIIKSDKSVGFNYAVDLFKCALLCFYDKFHIFDEQAVLKLFTWSFMLRVDMQNLGFDSINKYAAGSLDENDKYTNHIPMFSLICNSRYHTDISNLLINLRRDGNSAKEKKWDELYLNLKKMNGMEG